MAANDNPPQSNPNERRRFQRIAFSTKVDIKQGALSWVANLKDISFKGALTSKPDQWQNAEPKESFTIDVIIDAEHHIQFIATFKHQEADHLGFHCENMDLDSASTLRRLVELNLGNSTLLERELTMLVSSD